MTQETGNEHAAQRAGLDASRGYLIVLLVFDPGEQVTVVRPLAAKYQRAENLGDLQQRTQNELRALHRTSMGVL